MKHLVRIKIHGIRIGRWSNPLDLDIANHKNLGHCVAHFTIARADKGWRNSDPFKSPTAQNECRYPQTALCTSGADTNTTTGDGTEAFRVAFHAGVFRCQFRKKAQIGPYRGNAHDKINKCLIL
jgi:hypothetical protein